MTDKTPEFMPQHKVDALNEAFKHFPDSLMKSELAYAIDAVMNAYDCKGEDRALMLMFLLERTDGVEMVTDEIAEAMGQKGGATLQ